MIFHFVCTISYALHDKIWLMVTITVRHIPEWLPWLSYKPLARLGYNIGQETMYEPIRFVRESMVSNYFVCLQVFEELIGLL